MEVANRPGSGKMLVVSESTALDCSELEGILMVLIWLCNVVWPAAVLQCSLVE